MNLKWILNRLFHPIQFDLNAPDLYIPCMAYMTYVLLVGYIHGLKNAFR